MSDEVGPAGWRASLPPATHHRYMQGPYPALCVRIAPPSARGHRAKRPACRTRRAALQAAGHHSRPGRAHGAARRSQPSAGTSCHRSHAGRAHASRAAPSRASRARGATGRSGANPSARRAGPRQPRQLRARAAAPPDRRTSRAHGVGGRSRGAVLLGDARALAACVAGGAGARRGLRAAFARGRLAIAAAAHAGCVAAVEALRHGA
jgi:hypothetical protein